MNVVRAVDLLGDGLDGALDALGRIVERVRGALGEVVQQRLGELQRAVAALAPHIRFRQRNALVLRPCVHELQLGGRIGGEAVQRHNRGDAELAHVLHVALEVDNAIFQRGNVFLGQIRLGHARVVLDGADRGDNDCAGNIQAAVARLDVEEFLCTEVRSEPGLREHDVCVLLRGAGGNQGVAAVGDVGEGAAVDERWGPAQGLHQVWVHSVLQQRRHRAFRPEVARGDRLLVVGQADGDVGQALLKVLQVRCQAEDRHDFRRSGNGEPGFRRHAVCGPAEARDHVAQRAVVDVHAALPGHPARVDAQRVALVDVVVDQGREGVVGAGNGVEVTGEVEVDLLHRHHLGVAAAGRPALDSHHRAERGLTQRHHGVLPQLCQRVGQADERGGFALAGRCRRYAGDNDQLAGVAGRDLGDVHLGHVLAVRDERILADPGLCGDVGDGSELVGLGDFDVCQRLSSHATHTTAAPMA